ncbi:hypothetical protein Tco_0107122 [Tanacetum coccineum]
MKRKVLRAIPSHYILPRWTMKAIDLVRSSGTEWRRNNGNANNEVSLLYLWSLRAKFTRLLKDRIDSIIEIKKLDDTLSVDMAQHVSDPTIPVTTKWRPKAATRVKSGMEMAMGPKQNRTCR